MTRHVALYLFTTVLITSCNDWMIWANGPRPMESPYTVSTQAPMTGRSGRHTSKVGVECPEDGNLVLSGDIKLKEASLLTNLDSELSTESSGEGLTINPSKTAPDSTATVIKLTLPYGFDWAKLSKYCI